jgi:arylsulfatase A-like enzyme
MGVTSALGEGEEGLGSRQARDEITLAAYLKQRGYRTGIVGKWHLGYGEGQNPLNFGFDEFRGMLHGAVDYHSHVNTFGRFDWWHNKSLSDEEGYITHLITAHTLELLEKWKNGPFFLYVAHLAIHFPWQSPDDAAQREVGKNYRDVAGPFNRLGPHPPEKAPQVVRAMIEELDVSVGQIIAKLRELHLDKNTLVFFCSDNGGIVSYRGGYHDISSNGPLRGAKGQLYEGGHRVPAVAWWPGRIGAGRVSDQVAMTMDILPTVLELTDIGSGHVHRRNTPDGIELSGFLFNGKQIPVRKLYWQHGNSMAIRSGNWKLIMSAADSTAELFDLESDPGEKGSVASDHPGLVDELRAELEAWHREVVK